MGTGACGRIGAGIAASTCLTHLCRRHQGPMPRSASRTTIARAREIDGEGEFPSPSHYDLFGFHVVDEPFTAIHAMRVSATALQRMLAFIAFFDWNVRVHYFATHDAEPHRNVPASMIEVWTGISP